LNAIRDNPDDVGVRLVYADWLTDHGDPLGEFIHLQCVQADTNQERRANELLRRYGNLWFAPLRAITDAETVFRGGFIERIHLPASAFVVHSSQLLDLLPALLEVSLTEAAPVIAALAACPDLARIRRLNLRDNHLSNYHVEVLAGSPHLAGLVGLDLSSNQITVTGIEALGQADLPGLRHLDLSYNPIGFREMNALAAAPSLRRLESFRMIRTGITVGDIVPLLRSPWRQALTEDTIAGTAVGLEGVPLLVEIAHERGQEELRLGLEDDLVEALAASPYLHTFKSLNLAGSSFLTGRALAVLLRTPSLSGLEKLDLAFCSHIRNLGADALGGWPGFARLSYLDLNSDSLNDEGASALAQSKYAGGLRVLRLSNNFIGDDGAEAIARSKTMTGLTELGLLHCGIGDRGCRRWRSPPTWNS
jgi:uncharacterized protein (TIGR02996 family)